LILKIIFKAGKTNNAIRLKLPIWLGCIPFLVLYLIPTGFISLLNNPAMLGDILPADLFLEWESVSEGFSLTFASGSWFSFAAAIALIVISILFYNGIYNYLSNVSESLTALHNNTYVESARTAHTEETVEDRDEDEPQPTIIEKDAYNVVLKAIGPNKIEIIKTVREATGLGLADAKNLVENMGVIKSGLSWEEAENLAEELREGGAEVELR
jgi:large subunit ribosomal protein L7/L12